MPPEEKHNLRKILVVDDDPKQFELAVEYFRHFRGEKFDLYFASAFEEGLQGLLSGRYAACLLDYDLGAKNGIDLIRVSREHECRTPIILLTGWSDDDIELAAFNAGATDFIQKTEINAKLLERILRYTLREFETMEALRKMAIRDDLTGLFNRRELERTLQEEWLRATRFSREFSFILFDLDHFKTINDTHGHQVGDIVLRHVSSLLSGQVRSVDRVARYGGEEFAIVQIESNRSDAVEAASRLRSLLADMPCILPERGLIISVTLSAGVASFPADASNVTDLIEAADRALYAAKAKGRNCVVSAEEIGSPAKE